MNNRDLDALGLSIGADVLDACDEVVAIRRDIHRHPEVANQEIRTQQVVLDYLLACGIEAKKIGATGVVGLIRGEVAGPVFMLRADMDALPIVQKNHVDYKSQNPGSMHACGHDAHVAMLLVAAKIIKKQGLERGAIKLMFQPAEEGGGGAAKMIEDGILEDPKVDASLAFHVWTPYPTGQIAALCGPAAASVDGFEIAVQGRGTHAATPEDGVDPVMIAAQIITSAQALITRRIGPIEPALLSFTAIEAGSAFNIIPDTANIKGTFRTFDEKVRTTIRQGLEEIAVSTARCFGGSAQYTSLIDHGPVINDPSIAKLAQSTAKRIVGTKRIIKPKPLMVGEDIGLIQDRVPGALVLLGCGDENNGTHPHHHPCFDIDERVLLIGATMAIEVAHDYFKSVSGGC